MIRITSEEMLERIKRAVAIKSSNWLADIAAEDAVAAVREGDIRHAFLCAYIAAKYSTQYLDLFNTVMDMGSMDGILFPPDLTLPT